MNNGIRKNRYLNILKIGNYKFGSLFEMQKSLSIIVFITVICLAISCTKKTENFADKNQSSVLPSQSNQKVTETKLINPNPESTNLIFQYELAQKSHHYLLSKYKPIFSEVDGNLTITNKQGNSKKFVVNKGEVNENWSQSEKETYYSSPEFLLVEYYEKQQYALLLDIRYMGESWNVLLVNLNNNFEESYLEGWPHFSTTQSMFIAFNKDLYAGFSNNGIGIYSYDKEFKIKKEYVLAPESWGPQSAEWISNNEISIQANHICDNEECSEIKKLSLVDGQWILKESPSSSSAEHSSDINMITNTSSDSNLSESSSSIEN